MKNTKLLSAFIGRLASYFLDAWLVMLLWNTLMPKIFGLIKLRYWESMGLFLLIAILFWKPEPIEED